MSDLILAVDLGTHKCRAVAMDGAGQIHARAESPNYPTHRPQDGWAEQDPQDWWEAMCVCTNQVALQVATERLIGVAICGHGPSHLLLDGDGNPLGKALTWQDTRAGLKAEWINRELSDDARYKALGVHLPSTANMGPSKLLWLRDNLPLLWERASAVVLPKDYLNLKLTGLVTSDRYSLKSLVNSHRLKVDRSYARHLGIDPCLVPKIFHPWQIVGETTRSQERQTHLPAGLPVTAGSIDAFAGILGSGAAGVGEAFNISGTTEIVGMFLAGPPPRLPGILCYPLTHELSVAFAATANGGASVDWFGRTVSGSDDLTRWYDQIGPLVDGWPRKPMSTTAVFLPYLGGERSPIWDSQARGVWFGLDANMDQDTLLRSVLEGVSMSVRHNLDWIADRVGIRPKSIWVGGGGGRMAGWNRMRADVTGVPLKVPNQMDASARGAVAMALVALGRQPDVLAAASTLVGEAQRIAPDSQAQEAYSKRFEIYKSLYPAIQEQFGKLAEIRESEVE